MFGTLGDKAAILLSPSVGGDDAARTRALCHEMAHAYMFRMGDDTRQHGPSYQAVLRRLSIEGAFEGLASTPEERAALRPAMTRRHRVGLAGSIGNDCQPCYRRAMPTRNINLTARHSAFVDRVVKNGRYQNASEAVRDALRVLEQYQREQAYRLRILRDQLHDGIDALARGDYVEVDAAHLDAFLDTPMTRSSKRHTRARRP